MSASHTNWSGSLKFSPGQFFQPATEHALASLIKMAREQGKKIRVGGAHHSSTPLLVSDDILVSLKHFTSVEKADNANHTAWIGTGLTVHEAGIKLLDHGLSVHNTGDVDVQTVVGAISTGTHGTGIKLRNLSSMLIGCRIVCADGEIREFTEAKDGKNFFDALRVSLGSFGIMTKIKVQLLPAFKLERREWCAHIDDCMDDVDSLIYNNRNFDFYWYPRCDLVKIRLFNEPGEGTQKLDYAKRVEDRSGWAYEMLPKGRDLKFDEMEYSLPLETGPECFQTVRKLIKKKHRKSVAWRLLYRTVAADDYFISPFTGRDSVTLSLHQNAGLPFWRYFKAIEPVFREYGGRPHWGKKHTLRSSEFSSLYPHWDDFHKTRKEMDPEGFFLNKHLHQIFGPQ